MKYARAACKVRAPVLRLHVAPCGAGAVNMLGDTHEEHITVTLIVRGFALLHAVQMLSNLQRHGFSQLKI